ncbi:MAG: prolyl oligopeptidase family serine peptidase [Clostridiales Family XIII bacterium]|jgi:predicted peptidase|nr:prolyl oligopeptidase family serine peptidase [Clostridiales Family XIII bacterium]
MKRRRLLTLLLSFALVLALIPAPGVFGAAGGGGGGGAAPDAAIPIDAGLPYDIVVDVLEWGSAVTAVIVDTKTTVSADSVDADTFSVSALTTSPVNGSTIYNGPRTITNAYVSAVNEKGSPAERGRYIVLELKYGYNATLSEVDGSAAIVYSGRNYWLNLDYTVVQNKSIGGLGAAGDAAVFNAITRPIYDDFQLINNPVETYADQQYRFYEPDVAPGVRLPLVIFNHGGGEIYTDVAGGNEGAQLFANMGGVGWVKNAPEDAYILVPQRNFNGYSRAGVIAFVDYLVAQGKVDASRIYVTGPSAGGQETHEFLKEYPDVFAAAMPICPAGGSSLTAAQIDTFKDVPIWYIQAASDRTVNPINSLTPYNMLIEQGAADANRTLFANVTGTEVPNPDYVNTNGEQYQIYPDGHWSWVMVLNNDPIIEGDENSPAIMDWLFSQRKASYDLVVDVLEWGSAVTAIVIDTNTVVNADSVDAESFSVSALTKNPVNGNTVYNGSRTITNAYVSAVNEKGSPAESGRYIVLELKYGYNATLSEVNGSAAIVYQSRNYWLDLDYTVTLNSPIAGFGAAGDEVMFAAIKRPIYDDFKLVKNPVEGYTDQQYRLYTPDTAANGTLPLVIFNHGSGETYTANAGGNEGSQLFANMGGVGWVKNAPEDAYVLVPQRSFSGYSRAGVIAFVNDLIDQGKVDGSRIYVSGASAGGQETHNFLLEYPEVFAAGIPICPSGGANLSNAQLSLFKDVPIWYIHAEDDRTVALTNSLTPYTRLLELGADARRTSFPHVIGTEVPNADYVNADGEQYQNYPDGHWSWVMVLNNEFVANGGVPGSDDGSAIIDWLFAQQQPAAFDIVVDVLEWGSAVTAVIVDMKSIVDAGSIDAADFSVSALTKNPVNGNTVYDGDRTITKAYVSATNEKGIPSASGRYVVLELKYGYNATLSEVNGSAAIVYQSRNYWLNLDYTVEYYGNEAVFNAITRPVFDDFELVSNPVEGYTEQQYRLYTPDAVAGEKLPLVIFNHGSGETYTANAGGNEGSQLFANMGGVGWVKNSPEPAYVLVPQRSFNGYSRAGVIAFVQDLIAQGKVDVSRVYVSGASAGGQETHNFLLEYPNVFAAGIPICPSGGANLSNAQLSLFKHVPIWYIHAEDDRTVQLTNSLTPYTRLLELGAVDARRTAFPHVTGTEVPNADYVDADGAQYQHYPDGHWSWVMVLNNEFVANGGKPDSDEGSTIMAWLFSQEKPASFAKASSIARQSVRAKTTFTLDYSIDSSNFTFVSSNPSIAKVDANGTVTTLRAGSVIITLRAEGGSGLASSVVLNVTP